MRRLKYLFVVGLLSIVAGTSTRADAAPKLSYFERLTLANWKLIMRVDKSSQFWTPTGMILVAARPTQVMSVFMDFPSHASFMPKVKSCRVVRRRGKFDIWAMVILHLPWPVSNAWVAVKYNWSDLSGGGYRLAWERHRGSMRRYWGKLQLLPWGKHWTLAVTTMHAAPDAYVTRSTLNKGIVWGTGQLLHHLRAEVDRRRKAGRLKTFAP